MAVMNAEAVKRGDGLGAATNYRNQLAAVKSMRDGISGMTAGFNEALQASGQYNVETVKTVSRTQAITKSITEQKFALKDLRKNWGSFKDVIKEQQSLQRAGLMQWTGTKTGKSNVDLYMPTEALNRMDDARVKYGLINQMIGSIAHQTVNWGKNTQWAGRQITVGIGVPVAIAAAAMGKMALDADQQLTRLAKVYDTSQQAGVAADQAAINKTQELKSVRESAMQDARSMAQQYGASMQETLQMEADLAAVGKKGLELRKAVTEVTRIATLGELDHQQAMDMTIALMTAWNMKASDLTDTFNYMNAIENATSLQTKDFAEAIPRVASTLANLGVTVQETGVLMTAFAEGGVNAAEGANALKSATAKLLNPTKQSIAMFNGLKNATGGVGINIEKIVADAGGNLFKVLSELGKQMSGLDPLVRQKAIGQLFGTYQFNRLNVVLSGLGDVLNGVNTEMSQTAKAFEIANQSADSWAATAEGEIKTFQQSVSGRFKRAIETIKVEMAQLGQPLLQVGAWIVEAGGKILSFINDLPDGIKTIGMAILAGAAIAGPLIMLIGLFANLVGNIFKFASSLGAVTIGFKALTPEEKAQELMAKRAASAFNTEASAVSQLTLEIKRLEAAMIGLADQQLRATTAAAGGKMAWAPGMAVPTSQVPIIAPGKYGSNQLQPLSDAAKNAEKTKRSVGQTVSMMGGFAIGALAFKDMLDSSNSVMNNVMNISMILAGINMTGLGSALKGLFKSGGIKSAVETLGSKWAAVGEAATGMWTKASKGASGFGVVVKLLTGPMGRLFGAAGLIAGGIALLVQYISKMHELQDRQEQINESTKQWSQILGYVESINAVPTNKDEVTASGERLKAVEELRKGNEGLVTSLHDAAKASDDFASVYSLAMREALKVRMTGGSVGDARQAFRVSLQAAGLEEFEISPLLVKFDKVNLKDPEGIRAALETQINEITTKLKFDELSLDFFHSGDQDKARAQGAELARLFALGFSSADTPQVRNEMFMDFRKQVNAGFGKVFDGIYADQATALNRLGVKTTEQLVTLWSGIENKVIKDNGVQNLTKDEMKIYNDKDIQNFVKDYNAMLEVMIQSTGEALHKDQSEIDDWKRSFTDLIGLQKELGAGTMSVADATKGYGDAVANSASSWAGYSDEQRLAILNTWRAKAGLAAATTWTQGFADAATGAKGAVNGLGGAMDGVSISADQYVNAFKTAMSSTMDTAYSLASTLMDRQNQAETDGIQNGSDMRIKALENRGKNEDKFYDDQADKLDQRQKNEQKAFDKAWDAREKALDNRAEAVKAKSDAELKALEDADSMRQELFDREKTRISRMAELYNSNIDFNAALNTGNLDEAAKIYSSTQAQVQTWGMDDEQAALAKQTEQRKAAIETERDAKIAALDAQKEALKAQRDYETELFNERQDRAKKELDTTRQNARDALQAAEESERARTQATLKRVQLEQQYNRQKMEIELATLKAFVPQNEAELNDHIAKVEALYKSYGLNLSAQGEWWGTLVGDALHNNVDAAAVGLQNEIKWQQIGQTVAAQIEAGTGIDFDQVKQFLATGQWPAAQKPKTTPYKGSAKTTGAAPGATASRGGGGVRAVFAHNGGRIPYTGGKSSQADRVGVPRSAGIYPTEVPTILRAGEHVVDAGNTRRYSGILDAISNGTLPTEGLLARHVGGPVGVAAGSVAMYGATLAKFQEAAGIEMANAKLREQLSANGDPRGGGFVPFTGAISRSMSSTLSFARSQQGKPYIWGGTGPAGQDCSGFISILLNYLQGANPPWGRRFTTSSFAGGREIAGFKRGGGPANAFRIGVDPGSHMAGTLAGTNVESGSGHGPMVGGRALGATSGFQYQYYLPAADIPGLYSGGLIKHDNTLTNLHEGETVLTKPLTAQFKENVASGAGSEYNVTIDLRGAMVREDVDIEDAVYRAMDRLKSKVGRNRVVK